MTNVFFGFIRLLFCFQDRNIIPPLHLFPNFIVQHKEATRWPRRTMILEVALEKLTYKMRKKYPKLILLQGSGQPNS